MRAHRLTRSAAGDLEEIYEKIAEDNLTAAGKTLFRLTEAFERLSEWPAMGHQRPDLTHADLRFWGIGQYLVVYRPDTHPLGIIRVLHGARDIAVLLARETEDDEALGDQVVEEG